MTKKEEPIVVDGEVESVLGNGNYRVILENGHEVLARRSGKMRRFRIHLMQGDSVRLEISPYGLDRGRITYRHKK